ncbi:EpsG family protein [Rhodohalobacter mucosus]|uniref:EpsG family protein n=1 Tax=Rhodohalobacter mucosus TaxID=2079485 RepID=A0A316TWP8_9BACT|nr:EpsG family protein [Rhodohalobacter mucosus]PWN07809.1 hypothetical protein DDZ15_02000 [Rhodohalobacter mucosus]
MQPISKDNTGYYAALLYLAWPLLAMVSAFKNFREPWAKNVFWAFCAFYGFTFAISAESAGSDIVRYISRLEMMHARGFSLESTISYFAESGDIDVFNTALTFLISLFTDSQAIYTMVIGLIFGFFFSRNVWYVLDRLEGKLHMMTVLLLVIFMLVNPIWNITGVRMWTAVHIFIYGLLPYLVEGKKKGLLIASLSILVHFSMIVPVMVMFAYMLAGNRVTIYFGFFLLTFFISEIDLAAFNNIIESYAPEILQERTAGYRSETYVENFREGEMQAGLNWYVVWYGAALKWSVLIFLVLMFIRKGDLANNKGYLNLFAFTLLVYGIMNLFSSLPSGSRFLVIANLCAICTFLLYIQNLDLESRIQKLVYLTLPALFLFVLVSLRMGFYSLSAAAVMGNPIVALFTAGENISMNDLLRMII